MKSGVVLITDKNYIDHTKSLIQAVRDYGKIQNITIITDTSVPEGTFGSLDVVSYPAEPHGYYLQYRAFDKEITDRYDRVLYLDADVVVFDDLNPIIERYQGAVLAADLEPFTIAQTFISAAPHEVQLEFNRRCSELKVMQRLSFNAGVMLFDTCYNYYGQLQRLREQYKDVNYHVRGVPDGSGQPIINLLFNHEDKLEEMKEVSFWKDYDPKKHSILHFCHWDAPWNNNTFNKRLGKTYRQYYLENLRNYK